MQSEASGLAAPAAQRADAEDGEPLKTPSREVRSTAAVTLVVVTYLALSVASNWTTWTHGVAHSIQTSGGTDIQEEIWFLAQTPWALLHGINPFDNNWLNFPFGINLLDNTSMAVLGILGAPITFLFGPIATFNVLTDLAYASSATAAFFMIRRFVAWQPAAFVGGLLYGFSPFAVATGNGHLFLLFEAAPPLIVTVLDRVLRTRQTSPARGGILFALCLTLQFYISTEIFASLVVMLALAAVVALIWVLYRRINLERTRLIRFGIAALAVSSVGIGYGAGMAVAGPHHIVGAAQPRVVLAGLSDDPVGWIAPTINQHFTAGFENVGDPLVAQRDIQWHVIIDNAAENGSYIGIPLLLLLVTGSVLLRRIAAVRFFGVMAILATVLSLGSRLHIDGHLTPIRLPFIILAHLPLLDSSVAARYVMFFWLFAALLMGVVIDRSHAYLSRSGRGAVACALLAAIALVPLIPAWPYSSTKWTSPAWFTRGARSLGLGSAVLVYPTANPSDSSAMVWQAEAHFRFRMPGGYAVFSSPRSRAASFFTPSSPLLAALSQCSQGGSPTLPSSEVIASLRAFKLQLVAVPSKTPHVACMASLLSAALGAPRPVEGVLLWKVAHSAEGAS